MRTFEEYLENLREPKDDAERGFQTAVMLIYEDYKIKKSIDEGLDKFKESIKINKIWLK